MPYIGNTTSSFDVNTNNINNGAVTTEKLASPIAPTVSSINGGPLAGTRNRIINGDMRIDQRNAGASMTPGLGTYTVDRWTAYQSPANKFTIQRNAGSVTPPPGFTNYLGVTSTSAFSSVATDSFVVIQAIEGFNTADFAFGTANAIPVTLSFWVRSSLTGTFAVSFCNDLANRTYVTTYNIAAANTWELKTITLPGDTGGIWLTNNGIGLQVRFDLGSGSSMSASAGAWVTTNSLRTSGSQSIVGTNGATLYLTGVQLEAGTVATPFEQRSYGQELALCQRYFETSFSSGGAAVPTNTDATGICTWGGSGNGAFNTTGYIGIMSVPFCVVKRAIPTITSFDTANPRNTGKCERHFLGTPGTTNQVLVISNPGTKGFNAFGDTGGASAAGIIFHYTAVAEL